MNVSLNTIGFLLVYVLMFEIPNNVLFSFSKDVSTLIQNREPMNDVTITIVKVVMCCLMLILLWYPKDIEQCEIVIAK